MNIIDLWNFITGHWDKIVLVVTTIWTLVQLFQIEVLKKNK